MNEFNFLIPVFMTIGVVVSIIVLIAVLARNYIKVPPNKVAVFYGKSHKDTDGKIKGYKVVTGGSKFKIPILEDVQIMDMASFQLKPKLTGIPGKDGVQVSIEAVATCKIKSDQNSLSAAVERFLGKRDEDIYRAVLEILEGQLRAVIGTMSVEQLINKREDLNASVKKEAIGELDKLGVGIDILNIQSITDSNGYIDSLGKKRTAEVKRDAAIGEAEANAETKKRSTTVAKDADVLAAKNSTLTAEAEKEYNVKQAQYLAETNAESARAEQAGPLAEAEAMQKVVVQQKKVEEEKERASIAVQEQKILVAEKENQATLVVPAKKQAEAMVVQAEGQRDASVAQAEGEKKKKVLESEGSMTSEVNAATAKSQKLKLEGEGEAAKIKAIAEAEAFKAKTVGKAEAEAIQAKLEAEASGLLKKAQAYKEMNEGAALQLILEKLPSILEKLPAIVEAAAKPMGNIDKVVMIGSDANAPAKFANNVPVFLTQLFEVAKNMGLDISGSLGKLGISATSLINDDEKK